MSKKARDNNNRWRCVTIGFRVSPEESRAINDMVKISGLSKQDYLSARVHSKEIIVNPNPKVFIGLKSIMVDILNQLIRLNSPPDAELKERITFITKVLDEVKGSGKWWNRLSSLFKLIIINFKEMYYLC